MKLNQDQFVLAVMGLGLFFYWLFNRNKNRTLQDETSRLNLRRDIPIHSQKGLELSAQSTKRAESLPERKSRSLQVFFNFNGHTFEAYEILGLPGGADLKQVQEAYSMIRAKTPSKSDQSGEKDLIDVAYETLILEIRKLDQGRQ